MCVKYHKNGVIEVSNNFRNISSDILDMQSYKLITDNSLWVRIFHHNNNSGTVLFTSSNALDIQTENLYSRLNILEKFRDKNNLFEFMAIQPELSTETIYRWTQSNNPTNTTVIADYTNITNGEGGLVKCAGNTLCARTTSTGNWWCAVGCYTKFGNGIPGFGGKIVKNSLDLYVRIDNLPENNMFKIFKDTVVSVNIYET